ncbi:2TM domain-containing protein [Maribius pontilimi]|uniref:2TM domain-containing protein n=1 Tax=Palleronia pontilimi TaxID=1964209 RepID=A0A934MIR7_9RHOB|nr:2TM domain-containing protein [Palleronia pontilimi]MBJ3764509.1 2TM domain-containing protein [Palleronia pontilimi]
MPRAQDYERARARAKAKFEFYVHVLIYAAVIGLLATINMITSSGTIWFIWPLIGWGLAVALHGARVFLLGDKTAIIDALTEDELRRDREDQGGF